MSKAYNVYVNNEFFVKVMVENDTPESLESVARKVKREFWLTGADVELRPAVDENTKFEEALF